MSIKKWLIAASLAASMATGASAATLSGSSSGEFDSEDAGYTCTLGFFFCFGGVEGASGVNTSVLEWPGDTFGLNHSDPARSSLTINDTIIDIDPVPLGVNNYLVGSLTWKNAASLAFITPDDFSAGATIDLLFTSPSVQTGAQSVTFNIENTVNDAGDFIFAVANGGFNFGFGLPLDLGGGLTLNGFSAMLLSGSEGNFANGLWSNPEYGHSELGIYANIAAVPLPAAGWLMIAGIGGLAALRRRRKAA